MKTTILSILSLVFYYSSYTQTCTPSGDEITYGTGDVWIGYVYDDLNFVNYSGFVNEGVAGNPDFDQNFGGNNVSYGTNGCSVITETFSVRYKLTQTFTTGNYDITVGGDDGYRLSLDGGSTWVINRWFDQGYNTTSYTTLLNGSYNIILEYYENGGGNRISFNIQNSCVATGDPAVYGTGNIWNGYVYDGINFDTYRGMVNEGVAGSPDFDQDFGGDNVIYNTTSCFTQTETFSVRYRLQKTFAFASYTFIVGADDGYRFSLDGGSTWAIDNFTDHSYNSQSYTTPLNGTYNMVIEYYENGGGNRVSFSSFSTLLPVVLLTFTGEKNDENALLKWATAELSNTDNFEIEKSNDGLSFRKISIVTAGAGIKNGTKIEYSFSEKLSFSGDTYYRLRITDNDAKVTYSSVVKIKDINNSYASMSFYPSVLTANTLNIKTNIAIKNAEFIIYDISGALLYKQPIPALNTGSSTQINISSIRKNQGIKIAYITTESGEKYYQKILIK